MTKQIQHDCPKSFGEWVITKLNLAGYQALFAGGCVRDQLLGRLPKDYDVATSALPDQVQAVFGRRRTIAIGAAFGVITVIGNEEIGHVEVATFRSDGQYSDGRRPDQIVFTDARNDALRRDFTINGLFYDPIKDQILDFVDGKVDIEHQIVRAIGNPEDRFDEDKLRMLRAVRFATTLGFDLEQSTQDAIIKHAAEIDRVSGERIAAEMLKLLQSDRRAAGLKLLLECELGEAVLPELAVLRTKVRDALFAFLNQQVKVVAPVEMTLALILLLNLDRQDLKRNEIISQVKVIVGRWKLSNHIRDSIITCLQDHKYILDAHKLPWSHVQPKLVGRWADLVVQFAAWVSIWQQEDSDGIQFCRSKLTLPTAELNPPALLSGYELQKMGITKGPMLGIWIQRIRELQLDGELHSSEDARIFVENRPKNA